MVSRGEAYSREGFRGGAGREWGCETGSHVSSPMQTVQILLCCCFLWVFLKADPEARVWVQVVSPGDDPSTAGA